MKGKNRKGKFPIEDNVYGLSHHFFRGEDDPVLTADSRANDYLGLVQVGIALNNPDNWGDEAIDHEGNPEGDVKDFSFIPISEVGACDIHGRPMDSSALGRMEWFDFSRGGISFSKRKKKK